MASLDYENGLHKQDRDAAGRDVESGKWPHQAGGCFAGAPVLRWNRLPGSKYASDGQPALTKGRLEPSHL